MTRPSTQENSGNVYSFTPDILNQSNLPSLYHSGGHDSILCRGRTVKDGDDSCPRGTPGGVTTVPPSETALETVQEVLNRSRDQG